jgi:hypothetical protein
MDDIMREKLLKIALVAVGAIFFTIYPLSLIWPSGWQWHGGHGQYYFQMICGVYAVLGTYLIAAARNPSEHRSLISFTVWSSIVHAGIMAAQATYDGHEIRRQRQNPRAKTHQFGAICTTPGNLCLYGTAWWGWEDSNFQPNDYQSLALSSLHRWPAPA